MLPFIPGGTYAVSLGVGRNWQASRLPIWVTAVEAENGVAFLAKGDDCFIGHHTVRPPAIGDDLLVRGQISKMLFKVGQRDVDGPLQVTDIEFISRTDVKSDGGALRHPLKQICLAHRFHAVAVVKIARDYLLHLCSIPIGEALQGFE